MKKRVMSLVLAGIMAAGLCGCGGSKGEPEGTKAASATEAAATEAVSPSEESTSGEKAVVEKPESISWWNHDGIASEDYIPEWDAAFEELVGVKLEHTRVANNEYNTLLETAFASGTEPNVFDLSTEQRLAHYASQGGVADLTDLVKESGLYDRIDPAIWEAISIDGRIYGIPSEMPDGVIAYVRQDWLDRLNMKAPTNYEEYLNMLRAFRDEIEECEIPLTVPGLHNDYYLPEFYWDAEPNFMFKDGKWVDGMQEEDFPAAMQRLQDAYGEGLIDLEAVTNKTSACRDKWYSGNTGVFTYTAGKWANTLTEKLQANFPDAKLTGLEPIEETHYRRGSFKVYCIDGKLSEKEVEQVFTYFLNVIFDGGEGSALLYAGVDGYHHETDANGNMTYSNMASSPNEKYQTVFGSPWSTVVALDEPEKFPQPDGKIAETLEILEKSAPFKMNMPVSETLNRVTSDLTATRQEIITKIVMGELSVEDGMNQYYKKAQEFNIDQILKEMNGES